MAAAMSESEGAGAAPKKPSSKIKHDLRTPINQILGYSELLQEEAEEQGQSDFVPDLQRIQAAAKTLLKLLDELFAAFALEPLGAPRAASPAPASAPAAPPEPPPAARSDAEPPSEGPPEQGALLVVDD